jgi:hypothetical protein
MNDYTADDIYVLNVYYLQCYCQTEAHYIFVIAFLQYRSLVQEYFHFLETREVSLQVNIDLSSSDYLQDSYNY